MDKEKYLSILRNLNGTCECKDLSSLFNFQKKAENLEKECTFLDIHSLDDSVKMVYNERVEKMRENVDKYYEELYGLVMKERVALIGHDENKEQKIVKYNEFEMVNEGITTMHCNGCYQQISIVA